MHDKVQSIATAPCGFVLYFFAQMHEARVSHTISSITSTVPEGSGVSQAKLSYATIWCMAIAEGISHLKPKMTWSSSQNQPDLHCAPEFEVKNCIFKENTIPHHYQHTEDEYDHTLKKRQTQKLLLTFDDFIIPHFASSSFKLFKTPP